MDFGILPPEINSARMYSGPGSAPMLAAATAWQEMAAELSSAAASYAAVVSQLGALSWYGPASASMAAAVAPYVAWMTTTATQAEQAADQARAAAGCYAAALAATVPPPVVAANRALLMALVAANIFGQNAPAMAATEAQYAEMWAQDAAAMYSYAGSSAAASTLKPFTSPQQTVNLSGLARQSAVMAQTAGNSAVTDVQAVLGQLTSALPTALQQLASPLLSGSALSSVTPLLSVTSSTAWIASAGLSSAEKLKGLIPAATAALAPAIAGGMTSGELGPGLTGLADGGAAVSAGVGRAGLVGALSVPQTWTTAIPARAAAALATTSPSATVAATAGPGSMLGGLPLAGSTGRGVAGIVPDPRFLERPAMVPRWPAIG
ncbi:PPE family protein [Mycobacterium sp. 23]|uniref:PPE family protein n=1 Tax=Mycobacterium sp. 23 TaxID=3400424 RepID=UPI003AAE76E7